MGETRVDLLHLLEDLRDAYPGSTEETVLTEIVANALDSRATVLTITTDASAAAVTIVDDGIGMRRRELARYHDIAASTKLRGVGIGFAGVGIKVALLICAEVLTETRRGKHHVASAWRLASRHKAPWRWLPPPGLVETHGTAVRLVLENPLSPLVDPGFIESSLRRNFQPLFEPALTQILSAHYPRGISFVLNGRPLPQRAPPTTASAPLVIRMARKRTPSGAGYLERDAAPLPEDRRGVGVSTFGKVIKRGWDWLGVTPAAPERIGGLIEVPALASSLTLNKADFIRAGGRGATYLAFRKAIQEAVSHQLAAWGDAEPPIERARRRVAGPVERDLAHVLADLAADFPLIASLVDRHVGGQRRLPVAAGEASAGAAASTGAGTRELVLPSERTLVSVEANGFEPVVPAAIERAGRGSAGDAPEATRVTVGRSIHRPMRYGLSIQFDANPADPEIGRLVESTVWVNEAHAAYRRAVASRSEGYHVALAVAMALAPLAAEPANEHDFITTFLARWGAALDRPKRRRRR
jgi:hypothetical protein